MTREQIEKEARGYISDVYAGDGYFLPDYEEEVRDGFISGAQWRINSVWHSTDELPNHSGFLAVLMSNGIMETIYYSAGIGFHEMTLKGYALWAYVSDLLPERKEVTK